MPEIIHFVVTETRSVQVNANSAEDAAQLAAAAFEYGQDANGKIKVNGKTNELLVGAWGNTTSRIKKQSLLVERKN